jgi:hypothetical protein
MQRAQVAVDNSVSTAYEAQPGWQEWLTVIECISAVGEVNYIIAYFQKHHNSPLEVWFNADTELHIEHLSNSTQRQCSQNQLV